MRHTFLLVAILIFCTTGNTAFSQTWNPYFEVEGRFGDQAERAQGRLFVPFHQDETSLIFGDIRSTFTDDGAWEGNFGLGARRILSSRRILGVYGFYDVLNSDADNVFHQGTAGIELLDINWGLRANGYIPQLGAQSAPGATAFIQSGNLVIQGNQERAYYGTDIEAEHILWRNDGGSMFGIADMEIWAAGGYFYFDNDAPNFAEITGPRVRVEARLYDLPALGNDSRIVFAGQYEYDDVRNSTGTASLAVRIPLGRKCNCPESRLSLLDRRMVTPIVRDIDIVTNVAAGPVESAKFARTGIEVNDVFFVDGNTVDPESFIENAGMNSLVIAQGGAGVITPANTVNLNDGQVILGGGAGLQVIGCETGALATFTAPGERPQFTSSSIGFQAATNSSLIGLNIETSGANHYGVRFDNQTNVLLDQLFVETFGALSEGVISFNNSSFRLSNSQIITAGANSDGVLPQDSQAILDNVSIRTTGRNGSGILVGGSSQLTASKIHIETTGNGANGVKLRGDYTLKDFTIVSTGAGIALEQPGTGTISNGSITTTTNAAGVSANASGINTFTLTGVTINSGGDGISFDGDADNSGSGRVNATIFDNIIIAGTDAGEHEIDALSVSDLGFVDGGTLNLNIFNNVFDSGMGTINLNEADASASINITQDSPGSGTGSIDSLNGIPTGNVFINGNVDFGQPAPPTP